MSKMTYTQWEFLLSIHTGSVEKEHFSLYPSANRCDKRMLDNCLKRGYVELTDEQCVKVVAFGFSEAEKHVATLYR